MSFEKFVTALLSGAVVGLFAAVLHFFFVHNLITAAERYESGEVQHFSGAVVGEDVGHSHAAAEASDENSHDASDVAHGHDHEQTSGFARNAITVGFTLFTWCGFALVLAGAMQIARQFGHRVTPVHGVLWGMAGFATFTIAPTLGLAPELPGSLAAALAARQVWWILAALSMAGGLAAIAFGRPLWAIAGLAVIALPHLIGAPHPESFAGVVPPEMASEFTARAIGMAFASWALLGWVLARLDREET